MSRYHHTWTPTDADTDGFKNNATGATTPITPTATEVGDDLAHLVTLTSSANLSAITVTITGTDHAGRALSEAIAGPNNNTVTTTAYFLTVTSIAISATLGSNEMDIGWAAGCRTPLIPMCAQELNRIVANKSGTLTYTVSYTPINHSEPSWNGSAQETLHWVNSQTAALVSATAGAMEEVTGLFGVRITVASFTATATLSLIQNGVRPR